MNESDRTEWLRERQKGIGGSDVAAILGLSKYKTPLDIFNDKINEPVDHQTSDAAHFGTILEEIVAKEFSDRTGMKVQRVTSPISHNRVGRRGQIGNAFGWARANIDRAVVNPNIAKTVRHASQCSQSTREKLFRKGLALSTDAILECKTASSFVSDQWGPSQEDEIKSGEVVTEHKIPIYYETQVQWYLGLTGASVCYVAVLIGGQDFRIYAVKPDPDLFEAIAEKCWDFWSEHVMKGVPPAAVNAEDVKKLFSKDNGDMVEASNEVATTIGEIRNIKERIKELETEKAALEQSLIVAIGDKSGFTIGGEKAATYKAQTSTRFDTTAFKKAEPSLYNEYAVTKTTRVLRVS